MKLLLVLGVTLLACATLSSALKCYTCISHEGATGHDSACAEDKYDNSDKSVECKLAPAPASTTTVTPEVPTSTGGSSTTESGGENGTVVEDEEFNRVRRAADINAYTPFCIKYVGKKGDKNVVIRECSPPYEGEALKEDTCSESEDGYFSFAFPASNPYGNGTICACKGENCNSSSMVTMAPFLIGLVGLLLHQTLF